MNNWQDIDSCIGTPKEALSTRCGGQGVVVFYGMAKPCARSTDRPGATTTVIRMAQRKIGRAMSVLGHERHLGGCRLLFIIKRRRPVAEP